NARSAPSVSSTAARNARRLGRPVVSSWWAWCRAVRSARCSRQTGSAARRRPARTPPAEAAIRWAMGGTGHAPVRVSGSAGAGVVGAELPTPALGHLAVAGGRLSGAAGRRRRSRRRRGHRLGGLGLGAGRRLGGGAGQELEAGRLLDREHRLLTLDEA